MAADDIRNATNIAGSGLAAQSARLRIIAQNIANAQSTGRTADEDPYRRQTVTFKNVLDKEMGVPVVKVVKYNSDPSPFEMRYMPYHPAANKDGYVKYPNVKTLIETADLKEAQRSYEANLSVVDTSRTMFSRTIDLMR
jgi:flagellar basal-body rod protein FlgC